MHEMVDNHRSSRPEFGKRPDKDANSEKYALIWFSNLAKFHKVPAAITWNYDKEQVIAFLRDRKDSGVPTWKRLMIVQGLMWHRVHVQSRAPDDHSRMRSLRFTVSRKLALVWTGTERPR
jgi:hypothetical protein